MEELSLTGKSAPPVIVQWKNPQVPDGQDLNFLKSASFKKKTSQVLPSPQQHAGHDPSALKNHSSKGMVSLHHSIWIIFHPLQEVTNFQHPTYDPQQVTSISPAFRALYLARSRGTFLPGAPNSCAPAPAAPHSAVIPPSRRARRRGASQAGCAQSRAIASSQRRQRGAMGGGSPMFFWVVLDD